MDKSWNPAFKRHACGLCRGGGDRGQEREECLSPMPAEKGWAESPTIFFHSVAWSEGLVFAAVETAGLSVPCVAVVSGNDVVQGGIFLFEP